MISLSLRNSSNAAYHTKFQASDIQGWTMFLSTITTKVWSPIIWLSGFRGRLNFQSAQYIALDFDTPATTLTDIKQELDSYGVWYVIATTKSHQVPKGDQPACDRFRVILKADSPCTDRELYEYNMRLFTDYWPCDPSCTDAARFFWPCKEVYAYSAGRRVPWLPFEEDYEREADRFYRYHAKLRELGKSGIMPDWLGSILKGQTAVPIGERHKTCYQLGATWAHLGWDIRKLYELTVKTALADIGEADLYRALDNGYSAVAGIKKS